MPHRRHLTLSILVERFCSLVDGFRLEVAKHEVYRVDDRHEKEDEVKVEGERKSILQRPRKENSTRTIKY
jgi:hypothetical protein